MEKQDQHKSLGIFDTLEKTLTEKRIIHATGAIMPPLYHEVAVRLRYLDLQAHKPITVFLNTPGGSLLDALGLYDVMAEINETSPITVIATGACMSGGMVLLQAGKTRLAYPNAQLMIHELSGGSNGKLSDAQDYSQYAGRLQATVDEIIATRSGITVEKLKDLYTRRDVFLSAKEAKKLHLLDGIVKL